MSTIQTNGTVSLRDHVGRLLNKHDQPNIYVLDADLATSTTSALFQVEHPQRFIECGISETSGVSIATGLATEGKIPFYVNFAMFCTGSAWTQLRMACYANANLKLIGTHPGLDNGPDGASHHANEDIALARVLPNLRVLVPATLEELDQAIGLAIAHNGPVYIRCARDVVPVLQGATPSPLEWGKADVTADEGSDIAIFYEGTAAAQALEGYQLLRNQGLYGKLVNIRSIKPLDTALITRIATQVKGIVTVENHTILGGLGGAIAEVLCTIGTHAPVSMVGVQDTFSESGPTKLVKAKYGVSGNHVAAAAQSLLKA